MKKLKLFFLILPVFIFVFLFAISATAYAADCGTPPGPYPQCGAEAGACVGAPYPSNHTVVVTTTFDADCNKVYGCEDKGVLPGQCGNPSTGQCTGSISYPGGNTCTTTYGNHSLNVSWDVQNVYGSCNIYIRGGAGPNNDEQISTSCKDSKTVTSFKGAPLTNNGIYELFVSNGDSSGNCMNQSKGKATIPCGNCGTVIEEARRQLIAAGGSYQGATCDEVKNKVCTDCTIFVPPNAIRTALCPGTCGGGSPSPSPAPSGSPGACAPDNKLTVSPSQPKVGDTLTFQYQAGEDVYIGGDTWSGGVNPNPCTLDSNLANRRYTCTAQSAVTNATWNHYWGNPKTCGSATYTITSPAVTTVSYRIAENPTDLAAAPWLDYTTAVHSTPLDYTFKDPKPGQKFIFVQFMGSNGIPTTTVDCPKCQAGIKLLGPDPAMTNCSLGFEGNNAVLNLTGRNFGSDKGTIKSGDTDLAIRSWKDDSIQAILQNAPTGQILPVTFANTDGQTGSGECSSISQLTLGAKVFCRAPASYDTDNVDLTLVDETGKKMRQTVRIDKKGVVQGLTQRLEDGKRYTLSIKAPKSLKRNVPFTAGDGTVSIPNFVLPVGDIFPLDGGDGAINALDKGELNREWNISGNATGRLGDFNQDGRVNSIDWACMRYDFGQSDDPEATIPPPPSPSPAPSASASASPSPRASVSPSPSPNPSP